MALLDIFKRKQDTTDESNTLYGQTQLGNNILISGKKPNSVSQQLLYVTTSSTTTAGRVVDTSTLSRNSTVMACIGVKARSLAQLPINVMYRQPDGTYVDALSSDSVGKRDKEKARQVLNVLTAPNNFQSQYEFWYQWSMWQDLTGEIGRAHV